MYPIAPLEHPKARCTIPPLGETQWGDVMAKNEKEGTFSRRDFLEASSGVLAVAGVTGVATIAGQPEQSQKGGSAQQNDRSKSDPVAGKNQPVEAENPSSVNPPLTDDGGVPVFKYPFGMSHKRLHNGGWSREVTVRELAVSKSIAGVNMRLTA